MNFIPFISHLNNNGDLIKNLLLNKVLLFDLDFLLFRQYYQMVNIINIPCQIG